jgi:uncharacterized membrane protein YfcA
MRQLLAALAAASLLAALVLHLIDAELLAELFGDFAFFTLLVAVLIPEPRVSRGQARR